ncbi:hypothetical protein [Roseisalinus antarcticus]|nr:hypothetical protein [Roseisalinus antarcticus]
MRLSGHACGRCSSPKHLFQRPSIHVAVVSVVALAAGVLVLNAIATDITEIATDQSDAG